MEAISWGRKGTAHSEPVLETHKQLTSLSSWAMVCWARSWKLAIFSGYVIYLMGFWNRMYSTIDESNGDSEGAGKVEVVILQARSVRWEMTSGTNEWRCAYGTWSNDVFLRRGLQVVCARWASRFFHITDADDSDKWSPAIGWSLLVPTMSLSWTQKILILKTNSIILLSNVRVLQTQLISGKHNSVGSRTVDLISPVQAKAHRAKSKQARARKTTTTK